MTYLNFHLVAATLLLLLCFPGRKCSGFAPARSSQHCPTPTSSSRSTIKILALPKDGTLEVFRTYTDINSEKEEVNQVTEAFNIVRSSGSYFCLFCVCLLMETLGIRYLPSILDGIIIPPLVLNLINRFLHTLPLTSLLPHTRPTKYIVP